MAQRSGSTHSQLEMILRAAAVLGCTACAAASPAPDSTAAGGTTNAAHAASSADSAAAAAFAALVLQRFAAAEPGAFDSVYPFERGRGIVAYAADRELPRVPGISRVAWLAPDRSRAVLVLSGHARFGNSGDETGYAEGFSGVYEASATGGEWHLTRRIPLDSLSHSIAQKLDVRLQPGHGLSVTDTLDIDVHTAAGIALQLNHNAALHDVQIEGVSAEYEFGGGLLWIAVPRGRTRAVLSYDIDVARDSAAGANSGHFTADYGHVRNQYYWHPRGAGWSRFEITLRAPQRVRVATDLRQQETVHDGERVVRAASSGPTPALSFVYDTQWQPRTLDVGSSTLALFTTPDFSPGADTIATEFERVYRLLSARFGEPASNWFVIAQQRALRGSGWLWRSNDMIGAAANGGALSRGGPRAQSPFGHEVAHGWVTATGPASNFLGEGWAMLAESILIEDSYGPEVLPLFWAHRRNLYHLQGFDGRVSIVEDPENNGIAYTKGPWILRMLQDYVGADAFARGLAAYMRIPAGEPAGIAELSAAVSSAAGRDVWPFLRPWVEERVIPHVTAHVEGSRVVVTQHGSVFRLPLEVDLVLPRDTTRRTLELAAQQDTLDVRDLGPISAVIVDPRHRLMLRSDRGEVARFRLRAPAAGKVELITDFHAEPFAAQRAADGDWVATVPLSAGSYFYHWLVDGEEVDGGTISVRPLQQLEHPYPR